MPQGIKELSEEQIELLKSPLPEEAISQHPTKTFLSTIKAIYVIERFNDVFGLGGWVISNEVIESERRNEQVNGKVKEKNNIVVKATFEAPKYGILIPDIFGGNDNDDRGDAFKGACTDALTKIGSYLYVGMDVFKGLTDRKKKPGPAHRATPSAQPAGPAQEVPTIGQDTPPSTGADLVCGYELPTGEPCMATITEAENRYSRRLYKKALCRVHQANLKEASK